MHTLHIASLIFGHALLKIVQRIEQCMFEYQAGEITNHCYHDPQVIHSWHHAHTAHRQNYFSPSFVLTVTQPERFSANEAMGSFAGKL